MQKVDLGKIIKDHKLSKKELANELFPKNGYPVMALTRIIKGEALLDTDQISKLSSLTGVSINDLFSKEKWKQIKKAENYIFTCGDYKAILNSKDWITKIYRNGSLFHEEVIHKKTIPLSEYFDSLNSIIIKSEQNESTECKHRK